MSDADLLAPMRTTFAEITALRPVLEEAEWKRDEIVEARTGIAPRICRTEREAALYVATLPLADRESGFDELSERMEEIYNRLDPLVKVILQRPARSLSDLAAKAIATASAYPDLWEESMEDLDHEKELCRDLIESVCTVSGIAPPEMCKSNVGRRFN